MAVSRVSPSRKSFADAADYYQYTEADLKRSHAARDEVFEVSQSTKLAPRCARMHFKRRYFSEFKGREVPWVLEGVEYVCQHPYDGSVFVNFHYSERWEATQNVLGVEQRAERMVAVIQFHRMT